MAKIKLTKSELKRQKEALNRFNRFLPTLQLKKQQLRMEVIKVSRRIDEITSVMESSLREIREWVDVFAEDLDLAKLFTVGKVNVSTGNVAGVEIPIYKSIDITVGRYDLFIAPLWIDKGLEALKKIVTMRAEKMVYEDCRDILRAQLRIVTQRVNLFEKVKIPEAKENIRIIKILLGDLFTADVVRGKIAKAKLQAHSAGSDRTAI